jgi:hypothetical protein
MGDRQPQIDARTARWESVYDNKNVNDVSWYQEEPAFSLKLVDRLQVPKSAKVIDVGGGASRLVDFLLSRGFSDLTVLDISEIAIRTSQHRLSTNANVTWLVRDLLAWKPDRCYDLWHDRAVFHFLMSDEIEAYRDLLRRSVAPGGSVIMATFAPGAPDSCSGLPVAHYDASQLGEMLGDEFTIVERLGEIHVTPSGAHQPFTWIGATRKPAEIPETPDVPRR